MKSKIVRLAVVLAVIATLLLASAAAFVVTSASDLSPPVGILFLAILLALTLVAIPASALICHWPGRALVARSAFTFTADARRLAALHLTPRGPAVIAQTLT